MSAQDAFEYPLEFVNEITKLFVNLPSLTAAKGQYEAEVKQSNNNGINIAFGIKKDCLNPKEARVAINKYIGFIAQLDIQGISYNNDTHEVEIHNAGDLSAVVDAYIQINPHNIDDATLEAISNTLSQSLQILSKQDEPINTVHGTKMQSQFFALFKNIPQKILGLHDVKAIGQVNKNGSLEVGFLVGEENTDDAKQHMKNFVGYLDSACAHDPERFGYDAHENLYIFKSAQEIYEVMGAYFNSIIPDEADTNPMKRDFLIQKAMAFRETLESIFDDFIPNMHIRKAEDFSKPRSVTATLHGLRAFLKNYDDDCETDSFYINPDEKDGEFVFTIGCSEFTVHEQPEHKLKIMEELYSALTLYVPNNVQVIFHESGDNIDIVTSDLRDLLPMFDALFIEKDLGGPEDVRVLAQEEFGAFDSDLYRKNQNEAVAQFDEATTIRDAFEYTPMRAFVSQDDLKLAYLVRHSATATISLANIHATILQEYEGAKAISKLTSRAKAHIVH